MGVDETVVARRLEAVRDRIASAGGDPDRIQIVAMTKGFGADAIISAIGAGVCDIGENRAQDLLTKADVVGGPAGTVRWHFVGRLQRNKVRSVSELISLWQTVDRPELAAEVAKRAPGAAVLVQVNVSGEAQKGGCDPQETSTIVGDAKAAGLDVRGLMTIGPIGPPEAARPGFRALRELADELALPVRSMGMTEDLEIAVQEGSTMLRIGRALFGPRPPD